MRACPTCKSDRCGNHAACARRAEADRERAQHDRTTRAAFCIAWAFIGLCAAAVERVRRSYILPLPEEHARDMVRLMLDVRGVPREWLNEIDGISEVSRG